MSSLNAVTTPAGWVTTINGAGGTGAQYWVANIAAALNATSYVHQSVLINIGVNDFGIATQAQWIADMLTVADAFHARWPSALVYFMYPWKQTWDSTAATFHGWIDTVIASRAFNRAGPDEAVWMKGSDNGATNSSDGTHYSAAGETACAAVWKTALGY